MVRLTIKWLTAVLTRLLYFMVVSVLLVALLTTLERGLPPDLLSRLSSSSQAAHLHQTEEGTWTTYNTSNSGLASDYILSIAVDAEGNKWFGTNNGVSKFDGQNWTTYDTSNSGLANNDVNAIAIDAEGNKWFGTHSGVSKFDGTDWTTYNDSTPGLLSNIISAIAIDNSGNVWVGTSWHGVSKFDGTDWTSYNTSNSDLTDDEINAIAICSSGDVWVGTVWGGVSKFNGAAWTTYNTTNSGLAGNYVNAIAIGSADVKWFGGCIGYEWSPGSNDCVFAAVSRFDGGWTTYRPGGWEVNAIAIDQQGRKWFGTRSGGVRRFDDAAWTTYDTTNSELASNYVNAIATDNEWNIWFATNGGGVSKYDLSPTVESITLTPPSPVKAEMVEFEITFSQQMSTSITPTVTFGQVSPHDAYPVTPKGDAGYTNGYLISDTTKWYGMYTFTEAMSNGTYTVSIAGAEGLLENRVVTDASETFVLDTVAPSGNVSIDDEAPYASSTLVTLSLNGVDATSGVSQMCFSNDGTSYGGWQGYATSASWTLSTGDGTKTVYVKYKDHAGNVSSPFSDTIILDTTTPTGSISINDGATYAISRSVNLTLSANDETSGLSQMRFCNETLSWRYWSDWESYNTSKAWWLSTGDGTKTVHVQYKDNAGNVGTYTNTDTIILDTAPPSSSVAHSPTYQATLSFPVSWSGSDATSGVASYDVQFRDGTGVSWEDWQVSTIATSTAFAGEEGHTYYFQSRARDDAGNVEDYPGGDGDTHTTVDVTSPSGSVLVNNGAIDTTSTDVTLKPSASDSVSGVSQMSFSNDGGNYSDWESYGSSKSWTLTSGDGLKTVYVRYKDNAGNISSVCTDTINLDTTVQPEYGLSINEGALFTNKITVTLTLPANPSTAQMMVSNDGGFAGAQWEPYATRKEWQITQYGAYVIPRTVYAKYKDARGVISSVYQDDIILDVTAPSSSITNLSRIGANSSARVSALSSSTVPVAVEWEGSDDVSGVKWYDVQYRQGSAGTWTNWLTGTTQTSATFNATLGYTYYFQSRAQDHAGNWEDYPGGDGDAYICISTFTYKVYLPLLQKSRW